MRELSMLLRGTMGSKSLTTAGILAMASAILTLPLFLISIKLAERHDDIARTGQIALQWTGTIIFLVLILLFRRFLVFNCLFKKANSLMTVLIILNLVYAAVTSVAE